MKKLLCYLGVLLLLGLAVLPPALRMFLPESKENEEEQILNESVLLFCKNDKYEVSTTYETNKINMIAFKKYKDMNEIESDDELINQDDINDDLENDENELEDKSENNENIQDNIVEETELDKIFNYLKNSENIIYNNLSDSEAVGLDFNSNNYENLDLTNLKKNYEEQKTYYETKGLTCTIRK